MAREFNDQSLTLKLPHVKWSEAVGSIRERIAGNQPIQLPRRLISGVIKHPVKTHRWMNTALKTVHNPGSASSGSEWNTTLQVTCSDYIGRQQSIHICLRVLAR